MADKTIELHVSIVEKQLDYLIGIPRKMITIELKQLTQKLIIIYFKMTQRTNQKVVKHSLNNQQLAKLLQQ